METSPQSDPFQVLGLPNGAGEEEIRARYLQLVKQFPPERDPARFREIRAAFEAAKDPLVIAKRLLQPPSIGSEAPDWLDAIEEAERTPPALSLPFLLSLGNRDSENVTGNGGSA